MKPLDAMKALLEYIDAQHKVITMQPLINELKKQVEAATMAEKKENTEK